MKKLAITILSLAVFFPHFAHADITTGLVGWWKMNDGSGSSALDYSGNNNTAVAVGSAPAVTWTTGIIGPTAAQCNGGAGFDAPHLSIYNVTNITTSFWVKLVDTTNVYRIFQSLGDWLQRSVGDMQMVYAIFFDSNASVSTGWDMWTFTADGTNYVWYKNGVLDNTTAHAWATPSANGDLIICDSSNPLIGAIEDVRLYNRALSQADVTELYAYREPSGVVQTFKLLVNQGRSLIVKLGRTLKVF